MPRFQIELDATTYASLCALADEERRKPAGQAEWMLRQAVEARVKQQVALRYLDGTSVVRETEEEA